MVWRLIVSPGNKNSNWNGIKKSEKKKKPSGELSEVREGKSWRRTALVLAKMPDLGGMWIMFIIYPNPL